MKRENIAENPYDVRASSSLTYGFFINSIFMSINKNFDRINLIAAIIVNI